MNREITLENSSSSALGHIFRTSSILRRLEKNLHFLPRIADANTRVGLSVSNHTLPMYVAAMWPYILYKMFPE